MSTELVIVLAIAVVGVIGYAAYLRATWRQSKELDKKIDPSKMRKWEDEE
jgi:hypothetical protein